jgi:hypothetical protein
MHLALALTELYLVNCLYIFLLFIVNINLHEGDDVHPHGMSHRRPNQSDAPRNRSHAVYDLQEGALIAAYRMFPLVGLAAATVRKPTVRALRLDDAWRNQLSREQLFSGKTLMKHIIFSNGCSYDSLPFRHSFWESLGAWPSER